MLLQIRSSALSLPEFGIALLDRNCYTVTGTKLAAFLSLVSTPSPSGRYVHTRARVRAFSAPNSPHPNPLPKGEGTITMAQKGNL